MVVRDAVEVPQSPQYVLLSHFTVPFLSPLNVGLLVFHVFQERILRLLLASFLLVLREVFGIPQVLAMASFELVKSSTVS